MAAWTELQVVEFVSRKRAYGGALAAVLFVGLQPLVRPALVVGGAPAHAGRVDLWAIYAVALLLLVATGGGVLWSRRIRALVNDELTRAHLRSAMVWGYWTAMVVGLGLYFASSRVAFTARGVAYLVVTPSVVVPLLVFAVLEYRAFRDG